MEDSWKGLGRADLKPIPHLLGGELRIDPDSAACGRGGGEGAIQDDFVAERRDPVNQGKRNRLCRGGGARWSDLKSTLKVWMWSHRWQSRGAWGRQLRWEVGHQGMF